MLGRKRRKSKPGKTKERERERGEGPIRRLPAKGPVLAGNAKDGEK